MDKKNRSQNYTFQEKNLLTIIHKYKYIIENKKSNAVTWREKETTWNKISDLLNANNKAGIRRDTTSLKKFYDNYKKNLRKKVSDEKVSLKKTGGGKGVFYNDDPNMDLALDIVNPKTVYGLNNNVDSDRQIAHCSQQKEKSYFSEYEDMENEEEEQKNDEDKVNEEGEQINDEDKENEEIIIDVIEDNELGPDWGDFKAKHYSTPMSKKLKPKKMKEESVENKNNSETVDEIPTNSTSYGWTKRNRPIMSNISSSELSKTYSKLADLKLELVNLELENQKNSYKIKQERETIEFELKKKSQELDILVS